MESDIDIYEYNIKKWFIKLTKYEEKDLVSFNWQENFKKILHILSSKYTEYSTKIDCFIFLTQILKMKFVTTDTEIKSYFNNIVPVLVSYLTHSNTVLVKYSLHILTMLLFFNENVEFIMRHAIKCAINGDDWQERYSGLIVIKLLIEKKIDFIISRQKYTVKIIDALVLGYQNCSAKIKTESISLLTKFISLIPNYDEISKLLNVETINKIYKIQCETQYKLEDKIDKIINQSISVLSNPLIRATNPEEGDLNVEDAKNSDLNDNKIAPRVCIDSSGYAFGIFPQELFNYICNNNDSSNLDIDKKVDNFRTIYEIFKEKKSENAFLRFVNSFFKFLSFYVNNECPSIACNSLQMMDEMTSRIAGVNLIASFHFSIEKIINTFKNTNVKVRKIANDLLKKIIMIIPTSQIIPYIINALSKNHDNWLMLTECISFLEYIFSHLNEIYNDIEWTGDNKNYDINIFLEILKLFDHQVSKVVVFAKRLIKFYADNICDNKEKFLIEISYYTNDPLAKEVKALVYNEKIKRDTNEHFDVATQKVISTLHIGSLAKGEKENEKNLEIFKKVKKYESMLKENYKLNADENLMEEILDEKGRIIQFERPPVDNYQNYQIDEAEPEKQEKTKLQKQLMKSRLKRYNDPSEITYDDIYDKEYNYNIKKQKDFSPIKTNENVKISEIYAGLLRDLKSKLNWEKQFKAIDTFRKILRHHSHVIKGNNFYFGQIIEALLENACSIRVLLARNSLAAICDIAEVETVDFKNSYSNICRILMKKMQDKNESVREEAIRAMICMIMFSHVEKWSSELINGYCDIKSNEVISNLIMCFGFFLKYHKKKIFSLFNWNKIIIYVTEQFNLKRNDKKINEACLEFFKILRNFFNDEEKFQQYLKTYFASSTVFILMNWMNL